MQMLNVDIARRNTLGFTFNDYGVDLSEYVFND